MSLPNVGTLGPEKFGSAHGQLGPVTGGRVGRADCSVNRFYFIMFVQLTIRLTLILAGFNLITIAVLYSMICSNY